MAPGDVYMVIRESASLLFAARRVYLGDVFICISVDNDNNCQFLFDSQVYARWTPPECRFFFDVKRIA